MSEIVAKEKTIAVPGELLAKGMECIPSFGTYREGENVYASRMGLVNIDGKVLKIIPVSGIYNPKKGDVVIGQVSDVLLSGWKVKLLTSPYISVMGLKDATQDFIARNTNLTKYFAIGDFIMCSISNVSSQRLIDVSMRGPGLRKLTGGRILKVNTNKVPRIIGKQGSMVSMIKNATGCKILVGQNGVIWLNGDSEKEVIAVDAIKMIESQSHVPGLTDKVKTFLEKEIGHPIEEQKSEKN